MLKKAKDFQMPKKLQYDPKKITDTYGKFTAAAESLIMAKVVEGDAGQRGLVVMEQPAQPGGEEMVNRVGLRGGRGQQQVVAAQGRKGLVLVIGQG